MITVEPVMDGPDYAPVVRIFVQEDQVGDIPLGTHITLGLEDARELFGKLGDAIKVIEANQDPEAPRA